MDDKPISGSDAVFARAYASAIKKQFQIAVGEQHCMLTSPVVQRGMAAGDLIYPQMTNYLIYKFADALQYVDNPTYTGGSAGSYIQELRSYIEWVKTRGQPTQVNIDWMNKARDAQDDAQKNYEEVYDKAKERFKKEKEDYPNMNFWQWASSNYPLLSEAIRIRSGAQTEFNRALQAYQGADATTLGGYTKKIEDAQGDKTVAGLNQDGLVADPDLIADAVKHANGGKKAEPKDISQWTVRVPLYSIATYNSSVQSWITKARDPKRDQIIEIDISQGHKTKWEDYGFKEVKGGGGVGFWPFFHAKVNVGGKWEERKLETSGREDGISLKLAMIGTAKFDVRPGEWDIADIKTLFPKLLPEAPNVLSPKKARIVSVLVGYDVELQVGFNSEMREEVNRIYEEVKKSGGSMSIFGFRVNAGAGVESEEQVETKFEDVKWDKESGRMSLTPTEGQVYPTILGAIAQRFEEVK